MQCYTHQINLVVGDYFKKSGARFLNASAEAGKVIKWFRSKTFILAQLWAIQEEQGIVYPLTIIQVVLTRWIAHYLAYRCLLDLKDYIAAVIMQDRLRQQTRKERQLVTGNADVKAKANEVLVILDKAVFWHQLTRFAIR